MKNLAKTGILVLVFFIMLVSCEMAGTVNPFSSDGSIPEDTAFDQLRESASIFTFATLFSVDVSITTRDGESEGYPAIPGAIVSISDPEGNLLTRGMTDVNGVYKTSLVLSSAPQDVTMNISAPGYRSTTVTVYEMVDYSAVERVLYLTGSTSAAQAIGATVDSDGDGVADVYDAEPDNSLVAFTGSAPGVYTVAFEDLYLRANAGDADYNDFIAQYSITQSFNTSNQLVSLSGSATAIAKMAGYNHRFGIVINFPGSALLENDQEQTVTDTADIILFDSTSSSVGKSASFTLTFENPIDPASIDQAPYDPYIYVYNTGYDIHLIGEDPLPGSNNPPGEGFQDADGFPWALLVPTAWQYPAEGQRIEIPYPTFTTWRESDGLLYPDWYLRKGEEPALENLPPYRVISGDPAIGASVRELTISLPPGSSYQLAIDRDAAGKADPNGDVVIFKTEIPPLFVGKIYLDPETGVLTNNSLETSSFRFEFWSKERDTADQLDTSGDPFVLIVSSGSGS